MEAPSWEGARLARPAARPRKREAAWAQRRCARGMAEGQAATGAAAALGQVEEAHDGCEGWGAAAVAC